jgi:hypothetical protein
LIAISAQTSARVTIAEWAAIQGKSVPSGATTPVAIATLPTQSEHQ